MHIVRLHRQHSSVVMTVPKIVCKNLELCAGDYVILADSTENKVVGMRKFDPEAIKNAGNNRGSDRKDSGGGI